MHHANEILTSLTTHFMELSLKQPFSWNMVTMYVVAYSLRYYVLIVKIFLQPEAAQAVCLLYGKH